MLIRTGLVEEEKQTSRARRKGMSAMYPHVIVQVAIPRNHIAFEGATSNGKGKDQEDAMVLVASPLLL